MEIAGWKNQAYQNPNKMIDAMTKWEREGGVKFLEKIGMKSGQKILDFGARVGHYSIPAAIVVGEAGLIYAMDKEQKCLDELKLKAESLNLENVKIVLVSGNLTLDFEAGSIDVALLYDVLHYFKGKERKKIYSEVFRVLKQNGSLSVYPKHVLEDCPADEFSHLCLENIKQEIQGSSFLFQERYCGMISHDDYINYGCVLNFTKRRQTSIS